MPFLAPVIAWIGATLAAGGWQAALLMTGLSMGASFAIKGITGLFAKNVSKSSLANDNANHSVTSRQPSAPRRVTFGRDLVGGIITFLGSSGNQSEFLHEVVTFTGHEIDGYEEILFGDEVIPFTDGLATGRLAGFVRKMESLGTEAGADFVWLSSALPQYWTGAHRQQGCACIHLEMKYDADLFSGGVPNVRALYRGAKVYDPRTPEAAAAWSENAALCVRAYLTAPWGMGATADEIDDELVIAAANVCDELVATHGGTEKRYTCNGTFDLSEPPKDILKDLLTAMSGRCVYSGGKWRIYAGAYREPVLAFDDDDLRGPISLSIRRSRRDLCNGVKGTFIDPANKWQTADFPSYSRSSIRGYAVDDYLVEDAGIANFRGAWSPTLAEVAMLDGVSVGDNVYVCTVAHVASDELRPGGTGAWRNYWRVAERIWRDVEFRFTKSASMCQRLAKIELESNRRQQTATLPYKLSAYTATPPDVISVNHPRFGWEGKTFEISQLQLAFDQGEDAPLLGVDVAVGETDAEVYAWSAADDVVGVKTTDIPLPGEANPSTLGGVLTIVDYVIPPPINRAVPGVVKLSWQTPIDQAALAGKTWVWFKRDDSGVWLQYGIINGAQIEILCGGLVSHMTYDFKVQNVNYYGVAGAPIYGSRTAP